MINEEMLAALRKLSHAEKLQAMQVLLSELAAEDGTELLLQSNTSPMWTPIDAPAAARIMLEELRAERETLKNG